MSELMRNIIRFLGLFFLQVFLLDKVNIGGYAYPFIYIFFILFLPLTLPDWLSLLIAFLTGLSIDIFNDSLGLHAAAATAIAFLRPIILRRLTPQYDADDEAYLDIYGKGVIEYSIYALILSFVFCSAFFLLERLGKGDLSTTIFQIIASTFFTFVLLLIYRYLFVGGAKGRT